MKIAAESSLLDPGDFAGRLLDRVELHFDDGRTVSQPFLPQELWSKDYRTASFLFEPRRVKTSLIAHQLWGPPLKAGDRVALVVDGKAVHRWEVEPGGLPTPDPHRWTIHSPRPGTCDPVQVELDSPIDALGQDFIAVLGPDGRRVSGPIRLDEAETPWSLTPDHPWVPGDHQLAVHPNLENCCGDSVGEPFEHPTGTGLGARRAVTRRCGSSGSGWARRPWRTVGVRSRRCCRPRGWCSRSAPE